MCFFYSLILASASPRRRSLLESIGIQCEVMPADVDETVLAGELPHVCVMRLAKRKAMAIEVADRVILAADTVVVLDQHILGKPKNASDVRRMIKALSGRQHEVITGVCLRRNERIESFFVRTAVFFRSLEPSEIDAYIETGEPFGKAGSYAIQGKAAHMVEKIEGSYTNVVGLPLCEVYNVLKIFDF